MAGDRARGRGRRRLLIPVAATTTTLAIAIIGGFWLGVPSDDPGVPTSPPVAAPPTPEETTATPTPESSLTSTPSPTPSRRAAGWRQWLSAFHQAIDAQQRAGGIEPNLAGKAHEKLRQAAEKMREGKRKDAIKKIVELTRDLSKERRKGRLAEGPLTQFIEQAGGLPR